MLSLLALVFEEGKVMKESDKVTEVEKGKVARMEKWEVILVLVGPDPLFPGLDADSSVKTVQITGRLRTSLLTFLLVD